MLPTVPGYGRAKYVVSCEYGSLCIKYTFVAICTLFATFWASQAFLLQAFLIPIDPKFGLKCTPGPAVLQTSVARNAIRETPTYYQTHGGPSSFALSTRPISVTISQVKYVDDIRVRKALHIVTTMSPSPRSFANVSCEKRH